MFSAAGASLVVAEEPLEIWVEPSDEILAEPQEISFHTNVESNEGVKIFYSFNLNAGPDAVTEYTEPIPINGDTEIWFFAFTGPGQETKIQHKKYSFLQKAAIADSIFSPLAPSPFKIAITEVAPREKQGSDWVELTNFGTQEYVLDGWQLQSKEFHMKLEGLSIKPGYSLVVGMPLHNFYDKVMLHNSRDQLVDTFEYRRINVFGETLGRKAFRNNGGYFHKLYETAYPTKGDVNMFE